jgi:hypothetical protein
VPHRRVFPSHRRYINFIPRRTVQILAEIQNKSTAHTLVCPATTFSANC